MEAPGSLKGRDEAEGQKQEDFLEGCISNMQVPTSTFNQVSYSHSLLQETRDLFSGEIKPIGAGRRRL